MSSLIFSRAVHLKKFINTPANSQFIFIIILSFIKIILKPTIHPNLTTNGTKIFVKEIKEYTTTLTIMKSNFQINKEILNISG